MMKYDERFTPETVEEQIDQFTYSPRQIPLPPNSRLIEELQVYYEEDQRSAERIGERLAQYMEEHENGTLLNANHQKPWEEALEERTLPMKPGHHSARRHVPSRFALVAAVFCSFLLVGSLLFTLRIVQSTHSTTTLPVVAAYHGLYLYNAQNREVSRLDLQTHKPIWQTFIPEENASSFQENNVTIKGAQLTIIKDTVYLNSENSLYALDAKNGHIRWSDGPTALPNLSTYRLSLDTDQLYLIGIGIGLLNMTTIATLNPATGKIQTIYHPLEQGWNSPLVVHGTLYYATNSNLYAINLSSQQRIWHWPIPSSLVLENLQVQNDILYASVIKVGTSTAGSNGLIMAFSLATGTKLWETRATPGGVRTFAVTTQAIYSASIGELDAFNAQNGAFLWSQKVDLDNLLVEADILYAALANNTGLVALKIEDGAQLWKVIVPTTGNSPLGLQDDAVFIFSNDDTGQHVAINSFEVGNGSQLWHLPLDGNALDWTAIVA